MPTRATESSRRADTPGWFDRALTAALVALVLVALVGRVRTPELRWSIWSDRDMTRSLGPLVDLPVTGAELNAGFGARIPGGGYHLLMHTLGWGAQDPMLYQRSLMVLSAVGALALMWAAWRLAGAWAGAVAGAAYVSATMVSDTLRDVWNPALTPPLAALSVAALVAAVVERRASAAVAWCLIGAFGLQVHLSWIPWLAIGTTWLLVSGPPRTARWLLAGLGVACLTYVPYVRAELSNGWMNTHLMFGQSVATTVGGEHGWALRGAKLVRVLTWVCSGASEPTGALTWDLRSVTLLGLALAWFGVSPARDPRVIGARWLAWMVPVGVALLVGDPSLPFFVRYFVVLVPLACVAAAAGLANGSAALAARHVWAGALARALVSVALAAAVWASIPSSNGTPENGWKALQSDVARVGAVTGWTLPEIAGRVVVISRRDAKPSWRAMEGVEYLLHQRGEAFAGSKTPPCGVLFREDVSSQAPDVLLRDTLVFESDRARVIDVTPLGNGSTLLRYDGLSRCPTSLVDRYVPPPEFAPMEALALTHPQAGAVARSAIPGGTRFYTNLEFPGFTRPEDISTRLHLFVDLARVDGALSATLSSEQLRGEAHLRGWFVSGLIHAPTLRLEGADHRVEQVAFSDGFVGMRAASTPLTVALPDLVEPVQVTLSFDLFGLGDDSAWPPADLRGAPTSVLLDPAWSAPPVADGRAPTHGG